MLEMLEMQKKERQRPRKKANKVCSSMAATQANKQ
jgi:hypothetical protein